MHKKFAAAEAIECTFLCVKYGLFPSILYKSSIHQEVVA